MRFGNRQDGYVHERQLLNDSIIENNISYSNGAIAVGHPVAGGGCRVITGGSGITIYHGAGNIVRNNVLYDNDGTGIRIFSDFELTSAKNAVYNNTVFRNNGVGITEVYRLAAGLIVKNNISYLNSGIYDPAYGCDASSRNICHANTVPNLTTDPKFVNAAGGDLRLAPGSPAIDKGVKLTEVEQDIVGSARPQGKGYDIGAFEFGASTPKAPVPASPQKFEVN
jgi:hypothetical protein